MNNQATNSTSGVQLIGLLLAVAFFGLVASWGINRWSKNSENVELAKSEEQTSEATREQLNVEIAKPSLNTVGMQPLFPIASPNTA